MKKVIIFTTLILISLLLTACSLVRQPRNVNQTTTPVANIDQQTNIQPSKMKTKERVYTILKGQKCAVIDLNNYIPTKDEQGKKYVFIVEFPDDPCVLQKPATDLPGEITSVQSSTIRGTNMRTIEYFYE